MTHNVTRVRHELKHRHLTVRSVERLTPHMIRILLHGPDLADFTSAAPDDHVKLSFPDGAGGVARRDYTPRAFDRAAATLTIDFALHDAGPATSWATRAVPGDTIEVAGPKGSAIVPTDFDWYLLVGDETALPAMARRIEELPAGAPAVAVAAITGPDEALAIDTAADLRMIWVKRPAAQAADATPLLTRIAGLAFPKGDGFVWIAAEAGVARRIRDHVVNERGHPVGWTKTGGYWIEGRADGHEKFES